MLYEHDDAGNLIKTAISGNDLVSKDFRDLSAIGIHGVVMKAEKERSRETEQLHNIEWQELSQPTVSLG